MDVTLRRHCGMPPHDVDVHVSWRRREQESSSSSSCWMVQGSMLHSCRVFGSQSGSLQESQGPHSVSSHSGKGSGYNSWSLHSMSHGRHTGMLQSSLLHSIGGAQYGVVVENSVLDILDPRDIGVLLVSRHRRDSAFFDIDLNCCTHKFHL